MAGGLKMRARIDGLDRVLQAVDELVAKDIPAAVRRGVDDAGKLILAEAKKRLQANGSVDTGMLLKSLGRRTRSYKRGRLAVAVIGARKDAAPKPGRLGQKPKPAKPPKYAGYHVRRGRLRIEWVVPAKYVHLVEFGTRPHSVAKGARLARKGTGKRDVNQVAPFHPGARPKPFLRPALDVAKGAAARLVIARAEQAIARRKARGG